MAYTPKFAERFAIAEWLKKQKNQLMAERPPWDAVAERIYAALDRDKTFRGKPSGESIRRIAKEIGIVWVPATRGSRRGKGNNTLAIQKLEAICRVLIIELVRFRKRAGDTDPLSPELQALYDAAKAYNQLSQTKYPDPLTGEID